MLIQGKMAKEMRSRIYSRMLETRRWKYRQFLRYLKLFKYVTFSWPRGEFLESYYVLMRYLDDVVDGDVPLPEGTADKCAFISDKISFLQHPEIPTDEPEEMLLYCFGVAESFGEDFTEETADILYSLLFDARRRDKLIIFPKEELIHHFHLLDVRGTIKATLKIFGDDPAKHTLLEPLGMACRHQYNLEDIVSDLEAGYVNIAQEECRQFGITEADLALKSSPAISAWMHHHALEGLALLEEHRRLLPMGKFTLLERMTFRLVYEIPARKTFNSILSNDHPRENKH